MYVIDLLLLGMVIKLTSLCHLTFTSKYIYLLYVSYPLQKPVIIRAQKWRGMGNEINLNPEHVYWGRVEKSIKIVKSFSERGARVQSIYVGSHTKEYASLIARTF